MATYNGERYLQEQLRSIADQSVLPSELVISDDASNDATRAILLRFKDAAPFPVTLIFQEINLGFAQNFSSALAACSGELILLSDQDDCWYANKVEVLLRVAQAEPGLLYLHDMDLMDAEGRLLGETVLQRFARVGVNEAGLIHGCASAVRRELISAILPVPIGDHHDGWIYRCADYLNGVVRVPERLMAYRVHGASASASWMKTIQESKPDHRNRLTRATHAFMVSLRYRPEPELETSLASVHAFKKWLLDEELSRGLRARMGAARIDTGAAEVVERERRLNLRLAAVRSSGRWRRCSSAATAFAAGAYSDRRLPVLQVMRDALWP